MEEEKESMSTQFKILHISLYLENTIWSKMMSFMLPKKERLVFRSKNNRLVVREHGWYNTYNSTDFKSNSHHIATAVNALSSIYLDDKNV